MAHLYYQQVWNQIFLKFLSSMNIGFHKNSHQKKIHPIVNKYRVSRSIAAFLILVIWSTIHYESASFLQWTAILTYSIVWPHIAFLRARNSDSPKNAELNHLLFDSFMCGVWISQWSFGLWPSLPLVIGVGSMNILTGGIRFLTKGYITLLLGAASMTMLNGFHFNMESTLLTSVISFICAFIFNMMIGLIAFSQTKVLIGLKKDLREKKEGLEGLAAKLAKYLSPQVYNSIFSGEKEVKVETYRKKLTVFFSDIEGFTALTESMESEELTKLLNSYLNEMSNIAIKHGGTIDKYIGDCIMIFFGDPQTKGVKEDAMSCVEMALEMRLCMNRLRKKWNEEGIAKPLRIRMGINTGFCTVGNFGSEDRLDYTIIGNQVNLASRLETNASTDEILISHETYMLVRDKFHCEKKDLIEVKGVAKPVQTYQVIDLKENIQNTNIITDRFEGFQLDIDLSVSNREEVANSLKRALEELEV